MSSSDVGPLVLIDGIMDAHKYKGILETHMLPHAQAKMGQGWLFMQDGDPKHTSQLMMGRRLKIRSGFFVRMPGWFHQNGVKLLQTPPYSPDINPIEHLWSIVKRKLKGRKFRNNTELWTHAEQVWKTISQQVLHKLVSSMPRRLQKIIQAKGAATKY